MKQSQEQINTKMASLRLKKMIKHLNLKPKTIETTGRYQIQQQEYSRPTELSQEEFDYYLKNLRKQMLNVDTKQFLFR